MYSSQPPPTNCSHRLTRHHGFTLIELIIVVAIIGILLAVAMPQYNEYLIRANKAAAKAVLMEVSSRQEQFVIKNGTYAGTLTDLNYTLPTEVTNYFDVTLVAGTNTASSTVALQGLPTFVISASGKSGTIQAGKPAAGGGSALSINQFGLKLPVTEW